MCDPISEEGKIAHAGVVRPDFPEGFCYLLPLDVHVYSQASALGLTSRRQKDIVTAQEITEAFREIWPDDPCMGDFALFGYGVTH